jgi:hypothetical protein
VTTTPHLGAVTPDAVAAELAHEQGHVDLVYAELDKAAARATLVEREGLARGRISRTGDPRDEELTGLFERDALVYHAARRRHTLDSQYEGLVFGRLDLDLPDDGPEVRYVGRIGIRDDDYEPLVIDWRAPAAAPFYRATPADPHGVIRRRVLQCRGPRVVGVEDDLMVAEAPEGMVVVGDGALLAALTRSRGRQMRDIVATIQRHQDEAIRAPAAGVTEITGGPGTGKTVVALHRAAYLLYADRRRYETGGILVVGPSAAYTAYIERVLPSLGEDTVTLRSVGDVVDAVTATRLDQRDVAALKGSNRMRRVLARLVRMPVPGAPDTFRVFVGGQAIRVDAAALDRVRQRILRQHQRNLGMASARADLLDLAFRQCENVERAAFVSAFDSHSGVDDFLDAWWPALDPREVLLWLADPEVSERVCAGIFSVAEAHALTASMQLALERGSWSVADVALIDDLTARLAPAPEPQEAPERGFYQIEELEDASMYGVAELHPSLTARDVTRATTVPSDPRARLMRGRIDKPAGYAHVLVDEAQDLSPMQWRMLGRRGRQASWTVVGDAAQSSWPTPEESLVAREEAFAGQPRRAFHMRTNYRNAREIFDYAAAMITRFEPQADIPQAVRDTGIPVVELRTDGARLPVVVADAVADLLLQVEGSVAVIADAVTKDHLGQLADPRVVVLDALESKGLEFDAVVVADPEALVQRSAGGVRALYVALTRPAHRLVSIVVSDPS